jgi:hypothetical protein
LLATIGQAGIRMFVPTESLLQQGRILFVVIFAVRFVEQ